MIMLNSFERDEIKIVVATIRAEAINMKNMAERVKNRYQDILDGDYEVNKVDVMNVHFLINSINEKANNVSAVADSIERILL